MVVLNGETPVWTFLQQRDFVLWISKCNLCFKRCKSRQFAPKSVLMRDVGVIAFIGIELHCITGSEV